MSGRREQAMERMVSPSTDSEDDVEEENARAITDTITQEKPKPPAFTPPEMWMVFLGLVLVACAGAVNVSAGLELNMFVSHVSGTTARIGEHLEGVRTSRTSTFKFAHSFGVVFSFMFGAFLCGLFVPRNQIYFGGKSLYGTALLGNSALLVATTFVSPHFAAAYLAAMACGLQNAMCTMHLGAIIRTTHVTGTATDIGSTFGRIVMLYLHRGCKSSLLTDHDLLELRADYQKLCILMPLWFGFFLGAFLGAGLYTTWEMGKYTFLVPAGVTGTLGILYTFFRDKLKRRFARIQERRLAMEIESVHDAISRTRSHIRRWTGRPGSSDEDGPVREHSDSSSTSSELEIEEMERVLEVMHEVEESLEEMETMRRSSGQLSLSHPSPGSVRSRHVSSSRV